MTAIERYWLIEEVGRPWRSPATRARHRSRPVDLPEHRPAGDLQSRADRRAAPDGDTRELRSFITGLKRDYQAVLNGLTLPYSSGKVEGNVNRMIKRQMYGRAGFALLRKRILLHPG